MQTVQFRYLLIFLTDPGAEILRECSPPQMCHVSRVMCHVSCVTCHVLRVTCHVSIFLIFFLDKVVNLIGGGSVINGAYPVQFTILTRKTQNTYILREKSSDLNQCVTMCTRKYTYVPETLQFTQKLALLTQGLVLQGNTWARGLVIQIVTVHCSVRIKRLEAPKSPNLGPKSCPIKNNPYINLMMTVLFYFTNFQLV